MISLFVGPKNTFALKNLKRITIYQCEKLEIVFSTSVSRCLSQLSILIIQECNELKHIIEEDDDDIENNAMSSKTCCFPVLKTLVVVKCNKLKSVFSMSMSKELPKLEVMSIRDADELEEIFKSLGDDHKVEIPTLKLVAFVNLPSLCHVQGIQFQTVEYHFIQNCKKLSLTSLTSSRVVFPNKFLERICRDTDAETYYTLLRLFREFKENPQKEMNRTPKADHENVPDLKIPSVATLPTNSKELISEQSTSQQHSLGQIDTTIKLSQGDSGIQVSIEEGTPSTSYANTITSSTDHLESPVSATECLNIEDVNLGGSQETTQTNSQVSLNDDALMQVSSTIEQQFPKDDEIIVSGLGMPSAVNSPPNSQELMNEQSMHQQHLKNQEGPLGEIDATIKSSQVNNGIEGGAILTNAKTITSSTHLELVSSSQEQDVDVRDFQETTKTNNDQVSVKGEAFMKVSSIIEEQFSKDDPSPSNSLPLPFSFQTHSMPFQGNPSQNVEDSSSPSLITCELEQLVSKKVLAIENLSLLTDFLVKHPSVLLRDTSLSNRYKGYAYNCLAELLKFLQTHSVLDVLGSSRSEFVELLQDVRKCGFDKDWLDDVEKRALFPDLHFSQDALQKLLNSEQHVTKEVEAINLKLNIFSQHVEDLKHQLTSSEAVLESIIQQKAQVLETKAALSAPLGY
ncbi:hypothetical protein P8452_19622 [Trifolium repens]|nr:hypothetical protein P8452_19622 [Trifolium repens]